MQCTCPGLVQPRTILSSWLQLRGNAGTSTHNTCVGRAHCPPGPLRCCNRVHFVHDTVRQLWRIDALHPQVFQLRPVPEEQERWLTLALVGLRDVQRASLDCVELEPAVSMLEVQPLQRRIDGFAGSAPVTIYLQHCNARRSVWRATRGATH